MTSNTNTEAATAPATLKLLTHEEVRTALGVSRDKMDAMRKDASISFPRPVDLGGRLLRWLESDLVSWCRARTVADVVPAGGAA